MPHTQGFRVSTLVRNIYGWGGTVPKLSRWDTPPASGWWPAVALDGFAASFAVVRALAVAVIATIAVTGAGTVDAEPRSIHESIGIDTLGSADPSTLSKPTRKNVKDCSEAVAGANLPNAILTGCNLAGADLYRREPDRREP